MTQHKSSMVYIPTTKEAKRRNGKSEGILNTIEEVVEKLYWTYYIHLPFYLMASFDSFFLHVFFSHNFQFEFLRYTKVLLPLNDYLYPYSVNNSISWRQGDRKFRRISWRIELHKYTHNT